MQTPVPKLGRREFFQLGSIGITGYHMMPMLKPLNVEASSKAEPRGSAEVVVLLFLQGGPSQLDTFDVKEGAWTPKDFDIQTVKPGLRMPMGLLPNLAKCTDKYTIIRSMEAWESEHARGTYYLQAGRIFSPARVSEIPSVGALIAYESAKKRKESDYLPPFVSMNFSPTALVGSGVLPANFGPMAMFTTNAPPFVVPEAERTLFDRRLGLLKNLDHSWRGEDPGRGRVFADANQYYEAAYPLLKQPNVSKLFTVTPEEHKRYGNSNLGDACAMARNLIEANSGTRFIFIAHDGWDLHAKAYDKTSKTNQYTLCRDLDGALPAFLRELEERKDAKGRRLIDKTFVACMGEFGRTPGGLTLNKGRDHYRFAAVGLFAGAGVKGGQILGATDDIGSKVTEVGWSKKRSIYPEDVLVTMYSAMGIDWSKRITNTPSGRMFEYVENLAPTGYMKFEEIGELFA